MTKKDGSTKKVDRKRSAKSESLALKKPKIEELLEQWVLLLLDYHLALCKY